VELDEAARWSDEVTRNGRREEWKGTEVNGGEWHAHERREQRTEGKKSGFSLIFIGIPVINNNFE